MSSLPKQRGVIEFLPERGVLSLTLKDQGWVHNPNVTPSSCQMKCWFFGMVSPITHTTQQNFAIGPFAQLDISHWSRHILGYLNQYPL